MNNKKNSFIHNDQNKHDMKNQSKTKDKLKTIVHNCDALSNTYDINNCDANNCDTHNHHIISDQQKNALTQMHPQLINIIGKTKTELIDLFLEHNFTKLDAKKLWPWIYEKRIKNFDEVTNISKQTRESLKQTFTFFYPKEITFLNSQDSTQKACLEMMDMEIVETIMIPDNERSTICVSCQVGCAMNCAFCHTGSQGLVRNLTSGEILSQILYWQNKDIHITNIVFMGMGEPFHNYKNITRALEILLADDAFNFSRHRITVSTCASINAFFENVNEFASKYQVNLAISLHGQNNEVRDKIMPVNRAHNVEKVIDALTDYVKLSNTDHLTFEYLLLSGINDRKTDALELVQKIKHLKCKVNLINFNQWPMCSFIRTDEKTAKEFSKILNTAGIICTIRKSKGDDILAACGQLKSKVSI